MTTILSVDPGSRLSGFVIFDTKQYSFSLFGKVENEVILSLIEAGEFDKLVCEDIVNQGVNGKSIIDTVRWTGRFDYACTKIGKPYEYISRPSVKRHLTGKVNKIKDSHIRTKVIERMEPYFSRKNPGKLRGVTADVWSALALSLTFSDLEKQKESEPNGV